MRIILLLAAVATSGCSSLGIKSERIFQKSVPEPAPKIVTEDIKQAADYLATNVEEPMSSGVAVDLSQRVGAPERPLASSEAVSKALTKGGNRHDRDVAEIMEWLDSYEGAELEGTGLSVWGAGGGLAVVAVIALCVLVPALIPLVLQLAQIAFSTSRAVLKQTVTSMHTAIKEFDKENPEAADELKGFLSKNMDLKSKAIIKKIRGGQL